MIWCLGTVVLHHSPAFLTPEKLGPPRAELSAEIDGSREIVSWVGSGLGLTQRYLMFARVGRETMEFQLIGTDETGEKRSIPTALDLAPDLDFWHRHVYEHKNGKFHHNIQSISKSRRTYLDYLCRTVPGPEGRPYRSIALLATGRRFPTLDRARRGDSVDSVEPRIRVFDDFECPSNDPSAEAP